MVLTSHWKTLFQWKELIFLFLPLRLQATVASQEILTVLKMTIKWWVFNFFPLFTVAWQRIWATQFTCRPTCWEGTTPKILVEWVWEWSAVPESVDQQLICHEVAHSGEVNPVAPVWLRISQHCSEDQMIRFIYEVIWLTNLYCKYGVL